jgi:alpha-galactosidase
MLDRHAASVLSLDEIVDMVDELIEAHGEAMPEGVRASGAGAGRI